jgi:hypothetical protein
MSSGKVVFHLGGGDMNKKNQWPPTSTTSTLLQEKQTEEPPTNPTTSILYQQLLQDDICASLTMKLYKMNPIELFRQLASRLLDF